MSSFVFVTQVAPFAYIGKFGLSQAANNFCFNIAQYCDCNHVSLIPISVVEKIDRNHEKSDSCKYIQIRLFPHKYIGKWLNNAIENISAYMKIVRMSEKDIWFYNIIFPNFLLFILLKWFSGKNVYVLLADYDPSRYPLFIRKMIPFALQKSDGIISLSGRCHIKGQEILNIPGIIPIEKIQKEPGQFYVNHRFLLSGTINATTGLSLALEVFENVPEAKLFISGHVGEKEKLIIDSYLKHCKNITYLGFFNEYSEYIRLLKSVDFVLSFRQPDAELNTYNFPSKIFETLAYNRPVISTMEYPELEGVNYIYSPYDKEQLTKLIRELLTWRKEEANPYLDNYQKLSEKFSELAWCKGFETIMNRKKTQND